MTPSPKSLFLVFSLLILGFLAPISAFDEFKVVKVLEVADDSTANEYGIKEQIVKVQVENEGELFIKNSVPESQAYAIKAEEGRKYLISLEGGEIFITDHYREPVIIALIGLFLALVIIFGGFRGVKAILSLLLTGLSIVYFLLPGIQDGQSPILLAVIVSAFATAATMLLIAGWTKKSLAATIGTTGGVAAAGLIATSVINMAPLSGLASTEAHILLANLGNNQLNFQGILAAGILIASLGAAMDVAISIASSAQELHEANPNQRRRELLKHSMNIGKDIMGTMVNTLILAYTGSSIPLLLLLYNETGLKLLNMEIIATELSSAVIGSIGLLLAIPITASVSVLLLKGIKKRHCEE